MKTDSNNSNNSREYKIALDKARKLSTPFIDVFWHRDRETVKDKLEIIKIDSHKKKVLLKQRVWVYHTNLKTLKPSILETDVVDFESKRGTKKGELLYTTIYQQVCDYPKDLTPTEVMQVISSAESACLYSILSNHPIRANSKEALSYKEVVSQVMTYSEDTPEGEKQGDYIRDRYGKFQYRRILLDLLGHSDVDLRTSDPLDFTNPKILKNFYV